MDTRSKTALLVCMTCLFMAASCYVLPEDSTAWKVRLPRAEKMTDVFGDEKQTPQKLLTFVQKHRAEQCLQRIICQLSFKETMFGDEGFQFAQRLKAMESLVKEEEIALYRESRIFGLANRDPENCIERYSDSCDYTANEIIRIGLRLTSKIHTSLSTPKPL